MCVGINVLFWDVNIVNTGLLAFAFINYVIIMVDFNSWEA
jgi:hypothetical protein